MNFADQRRDFVAQPEPDIKRHLIVARARGVQLGPSGNALRQLGLDVHVDIFQLGFPLEPARCDLLADLFETAANGAQLRLGQHTDLLEHRGVGERAEDVVLPKAPVEGDGLREVGDLGGGTAGEAAGAGDNGRFFHARSGAESATGVPDCHAGIRPTHVVP